MQKIILASKSPRRQEILSKLGVQYEVVESNVEEQITVENSPYEWVKAISAKKARAVAKMVNEPAIIIGADTVITDLGKILVKPLNKEDAINMLTSLQGRKHTVYTGMTLIFIDENGEKIEEGYVDSTDVHMTDLNPDEIEKYVNTNEFDDKAGGYAIQGIGGLLIDMIVGSYYTVVGLPISTLYGALKKHGINLMDLKYEKKI